MRRVYTIPSFSLLITSPTLWHDGTHGENRGGIKPFFLIHPRTRLTLAFMLELRGNLKIGILPFFSDGSEFTGSRSSLIRGSDGALSEDSDFRNPTKTPT